MRTNKQKILWVDDDQLIRNIIVEMLEHFKIDNDVVSSGLAALEKLKKSKYDLLVTDLGMPEMSGWDLIKTSRKEFGNSMKIVITTGWVETIDANDVELYKVNEVISKPFKFDAVKKVLTGITL